MFSARFSSVYSVTCRTLSYRPLQEVRRWMAVRGPLMRNTHAQHLHTHTHTGYVFPSQPYYKYTVLFSMLFPSTSTLFHSTSTLFYSVHCSIPQVHCSIQYTVPFHKYTVPFYKYTVLFHKY